MNLCSDDHEEVCYEGRSCPACDVAKEKDREIKNLKKTNGDQLDTIHDLEREVESLKEQLP